MSAARVSSTVWPLARDWLAGATEALRAPRQAADELAEARELMAYWERRARRLPRWALLRRREARDAARRWRHRVRAAEERRYGRGLAGAAAQYAVERRAPTRVVDRTRRVARIAGAVAATAVLAMLLVAVAAATLVAELVLGAL